MPPWPYGVSMKYAKDKPPLSGLSLGYCVSLESCKTKIPLDIEIEEGIGERQGRSNWTVVLECSLVAGPRGRHARVQVAPKAASTQDDIAGGRGQAKRKGTRSPIGREQARKGSA